MSLATLIQHWRADPQTSANLPVWRTFPPRPAETGPLPGDLPAGLRAALSKGGIDRLYGHQLEAWEHARAGRDVVLATGTASGKTLAYNLPVLSALISNNLARALYLFPTRALAQDQLSALPWLNEPAFGVPAAIYDGDTPQKDRAQIRTRARILLSNPDMLHTGILPHHTNWAELFKNLRYVVIDEMHTYRGVFGSHVANVLRRLKRVAAFYGASPQFILTSATIGNPRGLAETLIESPVALVDRDGSSRGERHFLIYNPPVVDEALGLRKSSLLESVRLAQDLLANDVQSVVFARSRRSVEIILTYLQAEDPHPAAGVQKLEIDNRKSAIEDRQSQIVNRKSSIGNRKSEIRGYRSGYLPSHRREIEKGLRDGTTKLVVATNALELGIDIGGLGAAVLVGYPGSIASVYQQSGRAGRGDLPALAVLVASASPLDQFLAHHPGYFFERSPEQALINPDHLLILLNHVRCAMFELPFQRGEGFGRLSPESVAEFLDVLVANQEAHLSQDKYFWMTDSYPAAGVSLRSASPASVVLHTEQDLQPRTLGEVDLASACWMVHPNAVYLHEGQQYFVQDLNLSSNTATLTPAALDYYTEAQREVDVQVLNQAAEQEVPGGRKGWGELQVTTQVIGFKKLRWYTHENLGQEPLDMPPSELQTTGYWLALSEELIEKLRLAGAWTNDPNDYGPDWPKIRLAVRTRDGFRCQVCGVSETDPSVAGAAGRQHDVHHKTPFKAFATAAEANRLDNLVTLCHVHHRQVEQNVHMRSGLAGLAYVLGQLAPLFLMCDTRDLGVQSDPAASVLGHPAVILYDEIPAGIGFSQKLFEMHAELMVRALELVAQCECKDGCPSCVGPGGENGYGGKQETLAILRELSRAGEEH